WNNVLSLTVGDRGVGSLSIADGALVSANNVNVGGSSGGEGSGEIIVRGVDADGNASILRSAGSVSIGNWSNGTMTIQDGGQVVAGSQGSVAANRGTTGTVLVTGTDDNGGASTWSNANGLDIGGQGDGSLTVTAGGAVTAANHIYIGRSSTSSGTVVVSGVGDAGAASILSTEADLRIGESGAAVLTVGDGGVVSGGTAFLAYNAGSSGTLNIGAAADEGAAEAGHFDFTLLEFRGGEGTLVFNHDSEDYLFSAGLDSRGDGAHRIEHYAGQTILAGDGAGFAGITTVRGGTLVIGGSDGTGSLGGTINVLDGARIGGTGTIGTAGSLVTVGAGGILAPGNSIGTLSVAGDLTFAAGSIFEVELAGGGNTPGVHNDLLQIGGVASLDGGTVSVIALDPQVSYQDGQIYTILTAEGGVTG